MLNIPEFVPKDLVEELEACQKQLRILISNYQVLKERQRTSPEDEVIPGQIKQVEKYIIQYNTKQNPTLEKIRELIRTQENGHNSSKSSEDDEATSRKNDDEKPISEEEVLESLGLKNVARTVEGKIDHGKLSMKDRMAIVRGMRKRRRKLCTNGVIQAPQQPLPKKAGSPIMNDDNETESNIEVNEASELIGENQYNGFVKENERFEAKPPFYDDSNCNEFAKRRIETSFKICSQDEFLANLDLLPPQELGTVLDVIEDFAKRKLNYRNMTYIPEMSDKKHKISYTYLAPDFNSPPLLRTRQRRQVNSNTTSRMTSRSNSRATTPDRSITRQLSSVSSNDSMESNAKEKTALESELSELEKRSSELQLQLGANNKRTISTRKERSRLSEASEEATQLESRINQIKRTLAKL